MNNGVHWILLSTNVIRLKFIYELTTYDTKHAVYKK